MKTGLIVSLFFWTLLALACAGCAWVLLLLVGLSVGFGTSIPHFLEIAKGMFVILALLFLFAVYRGVKLIVKEVSKKSSPQS